MRGGSGPCGLQDPVPSPARPCPHCARFPRPRGRRLHGCRPLDIFASGDPGPASWGREGTSGPCGSGSRYVFGPGRQPWAQGGSAGGHTPPGPLAGALRGQQPARAPGARCLPGRCWRGCSPGRCQRRREPPEELGTAPPPPGRASAGGDEGSGSGPSPGQVPTVPTATSLSGRLLSAAELAGEQWQAPSPGGGGKLTLRRGPPAPGRLACRWHLTDCLAWPGRDRVGRSRNLQGSERQGLADRATAPGGQSSSSSPPLPTRLPLQAPPPCPLLSLVLPGSPLWPV